MKTLIAVVAVLVCSWVVAEPPVPDGQMRIVMHAHYDGDDGFRTMREVIQHFKDLGAEAVVMTPHAHVLPESETYLDKYTRWLGVYRIKFKKAALTAVDYLRDVDDACDILPVVPGFEVGTDPSHFLAVPCWIEGLDRLCQEIIKIGQQINTIGYPTAIRAIDRIMQETGGFMIQAHPFNPSYPFVYDFSECQSAVGVEFMNERWSDHDNTRDRLLEVQKTTSRPAIATSGVDFHLDEGDAGTIEGFLANTKEYSGTAGKAKAIAQTFLNATAYENRLAYIPSKRWVYLFGRTQNPMLIATLIRDGRCYAAYDEARIVAITAMPGMKYKPAVGSEFVISTRGIPAESQALDFCFVDDVTKEVTKRFIRWHDDPDGTRTASVKMSDLRRDASHPGKLIISSPWFTTSAICIEASASPQVAEQPKGPTSTSIPPAVEVQTPATQPTQPTQTPATKLTTTQRPASTGGTSGTGRWSGPINHVKFHAPVDAQDQVCKPWGKLEITIVTSDYAKIVQSPGLEKASCSGSGTLTGNDGRRYSFEFVSSNLGLYYRSAEDRQNYVLSCTARLTPSLKISLPKYGEWTVDYGELYDLSLDWYFPKGGGPNAARLDVSLSRPAVMAERWVDLRGYLNAQ
ncbi:MAG: hypothetical protein ABIJ72_02350 [bacterium]